MKFFIFSLATIFSLQVYAIDPTSIVPDTAKKVITALSERMGIPEEDKNKAILKMYNDNKGFYDGSWHAYWSGFSSLSAYEGKQDNTIELVLNTENSGIVIMTYTYDHTSSQILSNTKQIRSGSSQGAMGVYEQKKDDGYVVISEGDSSAILQKEGSVNYTTINISAPEAGVMYNISSVISLD